MALVNVMSTKLSERLQNLAIVGKVCALLVVVIMGIQRMVDGEWGLESGEWGRVIVVIC